MTSRKQADALQQRLDDDETSLGVIGSLGTRAARDGCGCPPWTIRCAHFEGAGVVLNSNHGTGHDDHSSGRWEKYAVYSMSLWMNCIVCGDLCAPGGVPLLYAGNSEAEALAVFHAAEARLLRGDEVSL